MRTLATVLLLMLSFSASADQEYWISVASFTSYERAESAVPDIGEQIRQQLNIIPDTSLIRYRVVAGPFASRDAAVDTLDQIKRAGIPDAWILVSEMVSPYEQFDLSGETLPQWQYELSEEAGSETPSFGSMAKPPRDNPEPAPPAEPPAGYQLNKLRRSH
jgi:hypothetical protein